MRRRSTREIAFRLRQETGNVRLLLHAPALPEGSEGARAPFPDAARVVELLQGTAYADSIRMWAEEILEHRIPLLGLQVESGAEIRWRRDSLSGKETGTAYFRRIPYLDTARAGDHKVIWELNRHQHLVLLAQAHRLTGRMDFLAEIERQLDSWLSANPYQRGINWTSALEVAFRALSWMWIVHLTGERLAAPLRRRLMESLYRHACHLEINLSYYFSPNTHLLGEAVALHALGKMFGGSPRGHEWKQLGASVAAEQMNAQVEPDGSHFERSSYYHLYALDMFLFHAMLAPPGQPYLRKLEKMAEYLDALVGPGRVLPLIGDDDGGRFFHPFGSREGFGRATLAACGVFFERREWIASSSDLHEIAAWWFGARALEFSGSDARPGIPQYFREAGMAILRAGDVQCIVRAGGFGPFRAGHSHSDALSIVARSGAGDLLIDPGTFSYADSRWRGIFRGSGAHNTARVNGLDQADPAGPFGWENPPQVSMREWRPDAAADFLDATCRARGILHRRRVLFVKPDLLFVLDEVEGSNDLHAEQFWHPGSPVRMRTPWCFEIGNAATLVLALDRQRVELSEGGDFGWRSHAYGCKQPAPVIVCSQAAPGIRFASVLAFAVAEKAAELSVAVEGDQIHVSFTGMRTVTARFPRDGTASFMPK